MTQTYTYDAEEWLTSTTRAIKEYADTGFSDTYDVIMEFPSTEKIEKYVPLAKVLVHFEIDVIEDHRLGFGDNYARFNYDEDEETIQPQEAAFHVINFDVGVWSSDRSGGTTTRLRAKEILTRLFLGKQAQDRLNEAVDDGDGTIEIVNFSGGRFLTDRINDQNVYRTVDGSLDVRVFSRTPLPEPSVVVTSLEQDPQLEIPD